MEKINAANPQLISAIGDAYQRSWSAPTIQTKTSIKYKVFTLLNRRANSIGKTRQAPDLSKYHW